MKLLMITRKVDRTEHLAGFIYNWVKKLSEQVDKLIVISWQEGDSSGLPGNVEVIHLKTKQNKLLKIASFKKAVWKNIKNVDGVFCHQMPIYTIIAAPFAKLYGKKVVSWYTHKQVDFKMKLMEKLADVVLTASKESFRLPSKKLKVVGHGIDTAVFRLSSEKAPSENLRLLSIGRISPTKDYETMVKAVGDLGSRGVKNVELAIIGEAGLGRQNYYYKSLQEMVAKMNLSEKVKFLGAKPNSQIPEFLQNADVFLNLSGTGSLDKAVLEAMACGCLVVTSNEAFKGMLPDELIIERDRPDLLAEKILWLSELSEEQVAMYKSLMQAEVQNNHDLDKLVKKIVQEFRQ